MEMEMPSLRPIESKSKIKLPEKSVSELEGENFKNYVMEVLRQKGEHALVDSIERGKISLGLEAKKAIETGNQAENSNPDFNVVDHMTLRAQMVAKDLIENKIKHLH